MFVISSICSTFAPLLGAPGAKSSAACASMLQLGLPLAASWLHLAPSRPNLSPSWLNFSGSWFNLGPSSRNLAQSLLNLASPRPNLARHWLTSAASWPTLAPPWRNFAQFWLHLAPPRPDLALSGSDLALYCSDLASLNPTRTRVPVLFLNQPHFSNENCVPSIDLGTSSAPSCQHLAVTSIT